EGIYTDEALCIADDAQEFANKAVQLYQDRELWIRTQQGNAAHLNAQFNVNHYTAELIERIHSLRDNLSQHRAANFWQAMINQQQLKATQYMSQWIEAKQTISQLRDPAHSLEIDSNDE
ncbi:MAG: hypothetical protein ABF253_09120, partial [Glaciecola sp.]